jgi:chromosome segregation ATPase
VTATAEQTAVEQASARLAEVEQTLIALNDQQAKLDAERLELQAERQKRADRLAELQMRAAFSDKLRDGLPALHDAVNEVDCQLSDVSGMLEAVKGRDTETRREWQRADRDLKQAKVAELRVLGEKQYRAVIDNLKAVEDAWDAFGPTQDGISIAGGVPFDIFALKCFGVPLIAWLPRDWHAPAQR